MFFYSKIYIYIYLKYINRNNSLILKISFIALSIFAAVYSSAKLKLFILFIQGCRYDCYLLCRNESCTVNWRETRNIRSCASRSDALGVRKAVIGCAATALPSSTQHGRCYVRNGMIYEHDAEGEVNCRRRIEIAIIQEISRCRVGCERALPSRAYIRYTSSISTRLTLLSMLEIFTGICSVSFRCENLLIINDSS